MLDKSIPYHDIIMGFQAGTPLPQPVLPTGYSFRFFREGDERHWNFQMSRRRWSILQGTISQICPSSNAAWSLWWILRTFRSPRQTHGLRIRR